jgi:hypothetical protein
MKNERFATVLKFYGFVYFFLWVFTQCNDRCTILFFG